MRETNYKTAPWDLNDMTPRDKKKSVSWGTKLYLHRSSKRMNLADDGRLTFDMTEEEERTKVLAVREKWVICLW